jgi:hypothetical protein
VVSALYFISLALLYFIPIVPVDIETRIVHYIIVSLFLLTKAASITILWAYMYTSVIYLVD